MQCPRRGSTALRPGRLLFFLLAAEREIRIVSGRSLVGPASRQRDCRPGPSRPPRCWAHPRRAGSRPRARRVRRVRPVRQRSGPARKDAASNSPEILGIRPVSTETVARSGLVRVAAAPSGRLTGAGLRGLPAAQAAQQRLQQVAQLGHAEELQQEQVGRQHDGPDDDDRHQGGDGGAPGEAVRAVAAQQPQAPRHRPGRNPARRSPSGCRSWRSAGRPGGPGAGAGRPR